MLSHSTIRYRRLKNENQNINDKTQNILKRFVIKIIVYNLKKGGQL